MRIVFKYLLSFLLVICFLLFGVSGVSAVCYCNTNQNTGKVECEGCSSSYGSGQIQCGPSTSGSITIDGTTYPYWTCSSGGGSCNKPGIAISCPPNFVRSDVVISGVCQGFCSIGTAQKAGACCDMVKVPASGCDWQCTYNKYTGNNRCKKVCSQNEYSYCRTSTVYTYRCDPVCSAPGSFTLSTPEDGASVSTDTVNLQWNISTFPVASGCVGQYKVYVGTSLTNATLYATVDQNTTSASFVGTRGVTYYWYVQAVNGAATTSTSTRSFTILNNTIVGTVYYDSNNDCITSAADQWKKGTGMVVTIPGTGYSASVPSVNNTSTGIFTISAQIGQTYPSMTLTNLPAGYSCSNGPGCSSCLTLTNINTPSAGHKFYLTDRFSGWWQVQGAGIYAGNVDGAAESIRSAMPYSSSRLILAGPGGTAAAMLRGSGSTSLGSGQVSDSLWSATSKYKGRKMDYNYFSAQMGVVPSQVNDWISDIIEKPTTTKDFHYMKPQSGKATVESPLVIPTGEKYVVFVNGDLRVNSNITVDDGGFLAFIVKGDIIIDPAVTSLQGIYISSLNFVTETVDITEVIADVPLEVQGTVVSWGSFLIDRSLAGANTTTPAETFIYRPDLIENMPDKMKTFAMNWEEVAPGTFGE